MTDSGDSIAVTPQTELEPRRQAKPLMNRAWAMPTPDTFDCPPIAGFVQKYLLKSKVSVDPFARNKRWATYTNDLNPQTAADSHMDAADFLMVLGNKGITPDLVIFDPPYSPRQVKEVYETIGRHFGIDDQHNAGRWTKEKKLIALLNPEFVLSFGWHSNGIGLQNGFELIEVLLVAHGAAHNDTICIAERRTEPHPNLPLWPKP
jgi:hypothetical protein